MPFPAASTPLVAAFAHAPANRAQALELLARRLLGKACEERWFQPLEAVVPHRGLRRLLSRDPALEALLAVSPVAFAADAQLDRAYAIGPGPLVRLSQRLLSAPRALVVAARIAIEDTLSAERSDDHQLALHAAHLMRSLTPPERDLLVGLPNSASDEDRRDEELAWPLEGILAAGGDGRLVVHAETGMNRYGTTPRPRPEAVQFSSSTASSISEAAFWFCELIRSKLCGEWQQGASPQGLRDGLALAVQEEILRLLGLTSDSADAVLCASGTDSELIAVMLALPASDAPLTNILIAPEESGRGVLIAGEGRFFDSSTQTGDYVTKSAPVWAGKQIETALVTIREEDGRDRPMTAVADEVRRIAQAALAQGRHVLLHQLLGSKTGLTAPDFDSIADVVALAPDRIDVVVDACQMRVAPKFLGDLVRRGWMVQVSGSKAYTGPPFSGAIVLPAALRARRDGVGALMAAAPAVTERSDWPAAWRPALPGTPNPSSFGPLMRWLAAIVEAELLEALPLNACRIAYERFGKVLEQRIWQSDVLIPLDGRDNALADRGETALNLAGRSIISFAVARPGGESKGSYGLLSMDACQRVFELLNRDVSEGTEDLSESQRELLAMPAHIGQPVALRPNAPSVLRLVIGARFFTIVGFAARGSEEAALLAEITDAVRAIDKLELLVRYGDRFALWPTEEPAAAASA